MEINKQDRSVLKSYFVEHALPTEENFAELIDGMLNQKDDGIVKPPGSPLCLQASGDATSYRKVLSLYESFGDVNPSWTLSLKPRADLSDPATGRKGLSIGTSTGVSRLFLDHATGNVGVGTVDPQAPLHVAGDARCDGTLTVARLELTAPEAWQGVTLHTEWEWAGGAHPQVGYFKDGVGVVHLRGYLRVTTPTGDHAPVGTVLFQLPEGHRPEYDEHYCVYSPLEDSATSTITANGEQSCVVVRANGDVVVGNDRVHQTGLSLAGITFRAAVLP